MRLVIEDLSFSYGSRRVLTGVTMEAVPGEVTAVIGPNAAGKTTLFRCIAGLLHPEGKIFLDGRELNSYKKEEVTKNVGYLPQESPGNAVLRVFEVVLLARQQTASWRVGDEDLAAVSLVLEELEIEELALRYLNELSGGQKQLVSIAQALVREPKVLLLDEPTSSLDLQHQLEVLELIRRLTSERGITTLIALHDLNLAARFADQFVVLKDGTVYAMGNARQVLTPETLRAVYGVNATVYLDGNGIPHLTPTSSVRTGRRSARVHPDA